MWVKDPDTCCTIYIEWTEGITKTRKGGLIAKGRAYPQTENVCYWWPSLSSSYPGNNELKSTGPLYLRLLSQPKGTVWHSKQPVGINIINRYMKDIAEKAGLGKSGKNITNHSTRKTLVKKFRKAVVDGRNIAAITGHKTEESLRL